MKNFKRIIMLLLTLALCAMPLFALTACGGDNTDCTDHIDADVDGKCDYCEKVLGYVYSVTVVDASGAPVANAKVDLLLDGIAPLNKAISTDSDGKAKFTLDKTGNYYAKVTSAPEGYELPSAAVQFKNNEATVTLAAAVVNPTYTVYVKDAAGNAVADVAVQICSLSGACQIPKPTDAEGKIESELPEDGYKALIVEVPAGYVKPADYILFETGSYTLTIVLELE
jgi:uncharacterized surface anchored protein